MPTLPIPSRVAFATFVLAPAMLAATVDAGDPCGDWSPVGVPNPGLFRNGFLDADADAGPLHGLLWSVDQDGSAAPATRRVLRRAGNGWDDLAVPDGDIAVWDTLAVAPGGDVWLGGRGLWPGNLLALPTVARRDAATGAWSEAEGIELMPQVVAPFADRGGAIEAMDVAPDGTVFAVGTATGFGNALDTSVPLFLVRDGGGWTEIADPDFNWPGGGVGAGIRLTDVIAFAADDAWAVGRHASGEGLTSGGLVVHWNGSTLEIVEDPRTGGIFLGRDLGGIDGSSASDLVVVGDGTALGGPTVTLARFDGSGWWLDASPVASIDALEHVIVADDGTAWATGVFADAVEPWFDGAAWSLAPFAAETAVRVQRMVRDGEGTLWAVGDRDAVDAYAQRLVCGVACPGDLDGSGAVGLDDLLVVLAAWGPCDGCAADLDEDGAVGLSDLLALLAGWGDCG